MKVLVTGSNGFIGRHVCLHLNRCGYIVLPFDKDNSDEQLNEYIEEESKKAPKKPRVIINKGHVEQYESVADFIYQKMTIGGLVDRNAELSAVDLKILKKLIQAELDEKKK